MDLELVFEMERRVEFDRRGDARKAEIGTRRHNRQAGRAPERMLGFLHVPEKLAEMDDAGQVRLGKLYSPVVAMLADRHGQAVATSISTDVPRCLYSASASKSGVRSVKTLPTSVSTMRACKFG